MNEIDQPQLANCVRETRQHLELSQAKFAVKLGVSFPGIDRWENGQTKPLPIALKQIDTAFGSYGDTISYAPSQGVKPGRTAKKSEAMPQAIRSFAPTENATL